MKRNLMSRLLLLVAFLTILYSCRNDQFPEKETYNNGSEFQLTSKTISLNESQHKAKLVSELSKAETELKNRKTDALGKIVNYGNGVSIDTDNVIYIENGPNYHTYTFKINNENAPADAPIENLLLSPLPDGTYREFLVTYNFTELEKIAYLSGEGVDRTGKMTVTELEKGTYGNPLSKESCGYQTVDVYIPCYTGDHHGGNVGSWGGCNWQSAEGGFPPQHYSFVALVCSGDSETIGGSTPIDGGGSGSNGGGETPGPQPNDPPCDPTAPTNPQPGLVDENGCPIGIPTLPNLGTEEPKTDCERLKEKTDNPVFKHKMDSIKERVTRAVNPDMHETSVVVEKYKGKTTYTITQSPTNYQADGTKRGYSPVSNYDVASMHNHTPGGIPIFSYPDLVTFYSHYKFVESFRKNEFSMFLVCYNGTSYALRMQDMTALDTLFNGIDLSTSEGIDKAELKVLRIYKEDGKLNTKQIHTADMAEKLLMRVLNSKDFGNGSSMFLYQYEDNQWKKLSQNPDGTIQKTPCPQP
ncbi:hypothetical protein MUU74_07485 [Chryseobacterium daecheongense]|uniref:hypothetical protein n=1 Tax=Chryseobacterium daecheongense TaxID=192389 RepID=UPI001FD6EA23|nr:hypothetical protein [Chryseobacterium daecheongense]UOU99791.1 hypothetical protein MUU74_07485 [Chryseobacterium daecheongense]